MCFLSIYVFMFGYVCVCLHVFTRELMSHLREETVQISRQSASIQLCWTFTTVVCFDLFELLMYWL